MEKKPFNDVDDHFSKHVGTPSSYNLKQMPKPIRFIGYFFMSFLVIATILIVGGTIVTNLP